MKFSHPILRMAALIGLALVLTGAKPAPRAAVRPAPRPALIDWPLIEREMMRGTAAAAAPAAPRQAAPDPEIAERARAAREREHERAEADARRGREQSCYAARTSCSNQCFADSMAGMIVNKDRAALGNQYLCKNQCAETLNQCLAE